MLKYLLGCDLKVELELNRLRGKKEGSRQSRQVCTNILKLDGV